MNLTIDIETVPAQRPDVLQEIREACKAELDSALESIAPPANYKDPAKISEWNSTVRLEKVEALKQEHEGNIERAYRKTGLDGAFGQICVIGYAINDGEPESMYLEDWKNEGGLLSGFKHRLRQDIPKSSEYTTLVIGHNVAAFDLRFLVQRSIVNKVHPHGVIARAAQAKPWESDKVFDTCTQWAGVGHRIKLDKLCKALSIPSPKQGIDGSMVWDYVRNGRIAEVADYCKGDVIATRAAYKRMTFQD